MMGKQIEEIFNDPANAYAILEFTKTQINKLAQEHGELFGATVEFMTKTRLVSTNLPEPIKDALAKTAAHYILQVHGDVPNRSELINRMMRETEKITDAIIQMILVDATSTSGVKQ